MGTRLAILALLAPPLAQSPLALRAARMLDVESGKLLEGATVLVEGERITAVNPREIPAGALVVELGERTLLPGLIDCHTHLTGDLSGEWVHRSVVETAADAA